MITIALIVASVIATLTLCHPSLVSVSVPGPVTRVVIPALSAVKGDDLAAIREMPASVNSVVHRALIGELSPSPQ